MSDELQGSHSCPPPTGFPTRWSTSERSSSTCDDFTGGLLAIVISPAVTDDVDPGGRQRNAEPATDAWDVAACGGDAVAKLGYTRVQGLSRLREILDGATAASGPMGSTA